MLLGLVIGVASGLLQFRMLAKFTRAVTAGVMNSKTVFFGASQFLLPLAVLLGCAFMLGDSLLWAAAGMVGVLVVCSFTRFIAAHKQ